MNTRKISSRRKFFEWGAGFLALSAVFKFFPGTKAKSKPVQKFLTKDGRLVVIDEKYLPVASKQASRNEIKNWVWPGQNLTEPKNK